MAASPAKMRETWKSVLLIVWIASTFLFGLFLFTRGFFLTRIELDNHAISTKWQKTLGLSERYLMSMGMTSNEKQLNMTIEEEQLVLSDNVPWATFKKAVLLVIDGLRYDFISRTNSKFESNFYQNNMLYVQDLIENEKSRSRLFKFIADPPTTTMQRLKALTTGSLPTFIDASANFASSAILEDNLLFQLKANNKSIVFMGDDTWLDLYPNYFKRAFPYPSFDVKDLDTVDNGVVNHLVPELNNNDWDVIIAHFLGVDHCGHRYGPDHPEMKRKLSQMDSVVRDVVNNLDNDTVLYVFGDHGMTQYGDHGGDSENETTAALFVYSKRNLFSHMEKPHQLLSVVAQVSIVPTLALQMNIPIPFSNVGIIIDDLFATYSQSITWTKGINMEELEEYRRNLSNLIALYQNSEQVYNYLVLYSNTSNDIPGKVLENLKEKYLETKQDLVDLFKSHLMKSMSKGITNSSDYDRKRQLSRILKSQDDFRSFIRNVYSACFEVWAKFDLGLMITGKVIMAFSSLTPYLLQMLISSPELNEEEYETNAFLNTISQREVIGFILSLISWLILTAYRSTTFSIVAICTFFQVISLFCLISDRSSPKLLTKVTSLKQFSVIEFLALFVIVIYACFLFSNSFVIMEGSLLLFLIQTLLFASLLFHLNKCLVPKTGRNNGNKRKKGLLEVNCETLVPIILLTACLCLRLSAFFWSCREEQSGCKVTFLLRPLDSLLHQDNDVKFRQLLSFGSIFTIICSFYYWCRKHGNLIGLSVVSLFTKLILPACGLIIVFHWTLQLPAKNKLVDVLDMQWIQQTLLPRCAYVLVVLSLMFLLWSPVSAYAVLKQTDSSLRESTSEDGLSMNIQMLFKNIRNRLNSNQEQSGQNNLECNQIAYAFGLHKVYSTAYLTMMMSFSLVILLLLGDGLAFSFILMIIVVVCLLVAMRNYSEGRKEPNQLNILILSFLTSYWFFATGHHATITSIRFDAGFVGLQGDSSNHILQGFLISLNTFSSHVVIALALPLLHIFHTTSMMETDGSISSEDDFKGELVLQKNSLRSNGILVKSLLSYLALRMLHVTITAFVACLHRRHLMVWKIFGPRFIFEAASFTFSLPFMLFGCLFYFRIDATVRRWIMELEDRCRTLQ